ncbi:MAG TPA: prepilin-type N-terminal cleavage/methylation domain-containing protein [Tepidisphaeraceae bacterium]|nr:prepilin-type N-terminal cleavage/methylation domain-containing protein [Tepidisphaeraceae bacterium]
MTVVRRTSRKGGFTLVEILIVVIILGILAAIVIPQFTSASQDARKNSLTSQLQTLRSQLELYKLQHLDKMPADLIGATPSWAQFVNRTDKNGSTGVDAATHPFGPYLQAVPVNSLNGYTGVATVNVDTAADPGDAVTGSSIGFVINASNGKVWGTTKSGTKVYNEADPAATANDE